MGVNIPKQSQKALITGASSGIGRELACLLAESGVPLILVARNFERLEEVARLCRKKVAVTTLYADLAQCAQVQKVCDVIERECPDLVVNNAGVGFYGDLVDSEIADSLNLIQTNCESVVALSQKTASVLLKQKRSGVIMNVSSVLAFFPTPGSSVYAATKCFVKHFSKALDAELRDSSIRVLCAFPGRVATHFQAAAMGIEVPVKASFFRASFFVLDPKEVALKIYQQIQKRKQSAIIDFRYKLLVGLCKLLPESYVINVLLKIMRKRHMSK